MHIEVEAYKGDGGTCSGPNCKGLPEYIDYVARHPFGGPTACFIKKGTIVAFVWVHGSYEIYCRDCIDDIFKLVKSKLDTNLWPFH